ncbi:hypothetical protein [Kitasatospora sp. NPDC005856]|uniref:hypothetical protein n=1 Tax=Kitasatospora sp. NPDC005856 TaxID=3154566 RepID=UPI0033C36C8D
MALLQINQELQAHVLALDELLTEATRAQRALPGAHCTAAADFRHLVDELVRCAVLADRAAGATWTTIGEALELSPDTARTHHRHPHLLPPPPTTT